MKYKKNIFYTLIICLIFLLGIYFRFRAYLYIRPLWLDECWLFFNIYELRYIELFQGLRYIQSAPPIFLVISKFIISNFGIQEIFVRLLPFICSLVSIPVFYKFSKIFLKKKWSIVIANLLFAINLQLIFYAQEFKQYSSDVLITMILFILLYKISIKKITNKQILLYIVMTTICPLISLPSYFIFAGWFFRELFASKKEYIIKLFIIQIPMFLMTTAYYFAALRPQRKIMLAFLTKYWENGFITTDIQNNINMLTNTLNFFFFFPGHNNTIQFLLLIAGLYILIKKHKNMHYKLISYSLLATLICSALKIYPIQDRIVLYLIPLFIVIMTICIDYITIKRKFYSFIIAFAFILSFSNYNIQYLKFCNNNYYDRFYYINPKELCKKLKELYKPQDTIFVYQPSEAEYRYYKLYYKFNPSKEIILPIYDEDKYRYNQILDDAIKKRDSCWFFYPSEYGLSYLGLETLINWKNKKRFSETFEYKIQNSYLLYIKK